MPRRDSLLSRGLEPLLALVWPLFVFWTIVIAALWTSDLGEDAIKQTVANTGLHEALVVLLRSADAVWLLLAAANLYLALAQRIGLATARRWAAVILATAGTLGVASVKTGWPLGQMLFTTRLGLKLGPVPLGWLLWWLVVTLGTRVLAERILPKASHAQLALAAGTLGLITQWNLEPLASKVRLFWFWYVPGTHLAGQPLWRNYLTWWLVVTALAFFLREREVATNRQRGSWQTALILILCNAVFLLAHASLALRH